MHRHTRRHGCLPRYFEFWHLCWLATCPSCISINACAAYTICQAFDSVHLNGSLERFWFLSEAMLRAYLHKKYGSWFYVWHYKYNFFAQLKRCMYDTLMSNFQSNDDVLHSTCCSHDAPFPMLIANVQQEMPKYSTLNRSMYKLTTPKARQQC